MLTTISRRQTQRGREREFLLLQEKMLKQNLWHAANSVALIDETIENLILHFQLPLSDFQYTYGNSSKK